MAAAFTLDFGAGRTASAARVRDEADLPRALAALGLLGPRPVVVVVGGAREMADAGTDAVLDMLAAAVMPVVTAVGAAVLDGGTDSGVMRLVGQARSTSAGRFPLVGVAAEHTVTLPGGTASTGAVPLDGNHSHFLLVPGRTWGDETPWLAGAATVLAGTAPSVTVLVNGGPIALADAWRSVTDRRPVLVLDGTGRAADSIAAASRGDRADGPALRIADSPRSHVVAAWDTGRVRASLEALLSAHR